MWAEGDSYRALYGPKPPPLVWDTTPGPALCAAANGADIGRGNSRCSTGAAGGCARTGVLNLLIDATGQQVMVSRGVAAAAPDSGESDV